MFIDLLKTSDWSGFSKVTLILAIALISSGCHAMSLSQASPMPSAPQQPTPAPLAGIQSISEMEALVELPALQPQNSYFQGIKGQVYVLKGNHMPTNSPRVAQHSASDIPIRLWVFAGKVQPVAGPRLPISAAKQLDNLAGWTVSDRDGQFEMGLPVGEYTVFVEQGQDLYLNSFLGDGSFASTLVVEGEVTEIQIVNSENAVF